MTDRISALTVILEHDIRVDDIDPIIDAIRMIKGIALVNKVIANPGERFITEARMRIKMYAVISDLYDKVKDITAD